MNSKRYKKLPEKTLELNPEIFEKLLPIIKKNCTTKFDESVDLNFQIYNKQKKSEINIRTVVNLPGGTGKQVKVAVVCEDAKASEAKTAGPDFALVIAVLRFSVTEPNFGFGIKPFGPKTFPSFDNFIIIDGVQINFSKFNSPLFIFSIKSSPPTISAPAVFASEALVSSHTTATLTCFPVPTWKKHSCIYNKKTS